MLRANNGASGKYPPDRVAPYWQKMLVTTTFRRVFAAWKESGMVSGVIGNHAPLGPGTVIRPRFPVTAFAPPNLTWPNVAIWESEDCIAGNVGDPRGACLLARAAHFPKNAVTGMWTWSGRITPVQKVAEFHSPHIKIFFNPSISIISTRNLRMNTPPFQTLIR
jgi:hypothetical protein